MTSPTLNIKNFDLNDDILDELEASLSARLSCSMSIAFSQKVPVWGIAAYGPVNSCCEFIPQSSH